jgi:hypothetical protein
VYSYREILQRTIPRKSSDPLKLSNKPLVTTLAVLLLLVTYTKYIVNNVKIQISQITTYKTNLESCILQAREKEQAQSRKMKD